MSVRLERKDLLTRYVEAPKPLDVDASKKHLVRFEEGILLPRPGSFARVVSENAVEFVKTFRGEEIATQQLKDKGIDRTPSKWTLNPRRALRELARLNINGAIKEFAVEERIVYRA